MSAKKQIEKHIAVVGAGPAGLAMAWALAKQDLPVQLVSPQALDGVWKIPEGRTTAILNGGVGYLKSLDIWSDLQALAADKIAPLRSMRLIDRRLDSDAVDELLFDPQESSEPQSQFGLNIPNRALAGCLVERLRKAGSIDLLENRTVTSFEQSQSGVSLKFDTGEVRNFGLVIAADGQKSLLRQAAGIEAKLVQEQQIALTFVVEPKSDHKGQSVEFHRDAGPLTFVPMADNRLSVVWVHRPKDASRLADCNPEDLVEQLLRDAAPLYQDGLTLLSPVNQVPIASLRADALVAGRLALIGEAAHALPPIGAQGFNSSLLDVAWLSHFISRARLVTSDVGATDALKKYEAARMADIVKRTGGVGAMNKLVSTPSNVARSLRQNIFSAAHASQLVRRSMMGLADIQPSHFPKP